MLQGPAQLVTLPLLLLTVASWSGAAAEAKTGEAADIVERVVIKGFNPLTMMAFTVCKVLGPEGADYYKRLFYRGGGVVELDVDGTRYGSKKLIESAESTGADIIGRSKIESTIRKAVSEGLLRLKSYYKKDECEALSKDESHPPPILIHYADAGLLITVYVKGKSEPVVRSFIEAAGLSWPSTFRDHPDRYLLPDFWKAIEPILDLDGDPDAVDLGLDISVNWADSEYVAVSEKDPIALQRWALGRNALVFDAIRRWFRRTHPAEE